MNIRCGHESKVNPDNQKFGNLKIVLSNSHIVKTHEISSLLLTKKSHLKLAEKLSIGYLGDF